MATVLRDGEVVADVELARRWCRAVRRVSSVTIRVTDSGTRCTVTGVAHRLPFRRSIPLRLALGLAELGVPCRVIEEDA